MFVTTAIIRVMFSGKGLRYPLHVFDCFSVIRISLLDLGMFLTTEKRTGAVLCGLLRNHLCVFVCLFVTIFVGDGLDGFVVLSILWCSGFLFQLGSFVTTTIVLVMFFRYWG